LSNSPPHDRAMMMSMITSPLLHSRTMKRFRNSRPSEEEVHRRFLSYNSTHAVFTYSFSSPYRTNPWPPLLSTAAPGHGPGAGTRIPLAEQHIWPTATVTPPLLEHQLETLSHNRNHGYGEFLPNCVRGLRRRPGGVRPRRWDGHRLHRG
jgi:hypothetical protein